ncbi:MAG: DUF1328 family protein [Flavisolibacter sp.]
MAARISSKKVWIWMVVNSTKSIIRKKPEKKRQGSAFGYHRLGKIGCAGMLYEFITVFIHLKLKVMLRWTIIFLVIAIIAAVFGFGGIAAGAAGIAKILFFIFLILFVLSLIAGRRSVDDGI